MENSSSVNVSENDKKKKRPRLVLSDSGSDSDSSQDSESSEDSFEQLDEKKVDESRGLQNVENENEKKRRLDVFEFDEYDNIDEKRMKKSRDSRPGSSKHVREKKKQSKKELAGSSDKSSLKMQESDNNYERRTKKKFDKASNSSGGRVANIDEKRTKNQFDQMNTSSSEETLSDHDGDSDGDGDGDGDDDGDLPISSLRQKVRSPPNEPVRSQGKNGILKVKVNKEELEVPKKSYSRKLDFEVNKISKSDSKKNKFSESKVKVGERALMEASSPSSGKKREKLKTPKRITPVKECSSKINRGSVTEKQKLRENLKNFLLEAGWKIDYRPRRSRRDYSDAVYISPKGSAYWSIVKAYDAFQKQVDSDAEVEPNSFSKDIKKLTRKTQKKLEREMKMKRKQNKKRKVEEETDEDSASDEDEDEDDGSGSLAKENSVLVKPLKKKKAGKDREEHKLGRCTLLVRSSEKGLNPGNEGYIAYSGKRTLLSWLIDSGIINSSEKVKYMNGKQTRVMLEGWVSRSGIQCSCCNKLIPVYKFENHAGSKLRQPYQNMYLESGVSLLQCQIEAWNKQEGSDRSGFHHVDVDGDDPNDDTCSICGDGGDLICCDSCPSTFHQSCLDIEMLPDGDWNCPNCICKFCKIVGGGSNEDGDDEAVNVMMTCGLCEKKYHVSCCQKGDDSSSLSRSSSSFCEPKCQEIFDHLQKILGVKHVLDGGFSWSLIHRSDADKDASDCSFPQRIMSNSKLAIALSVMDECFLPIVDRRTEINLVNSVVYNCGSNFSRLNFSGFYTIVLERGDEIVAAASIRIHGTQLAEMPFIGTRHMYRRQGMCRRLLGAIESLLLSLGIKKLIIPAIAEHMHTWTAIFGFKPFNVSDKQEFRSVNMVVFPGIDLLQKFLVKKETSEADNTDNSGGESIPPQDIHNKGTYTEITDMDDHAGNDISGGDDDTTLHNGDEKNDKSIVGDTVLLDSVVPLNENNAKDIRGSDLPDAQISMDSDQLDKTESKSDAAVNVGDSVMDSNTKAVPISNNDEIVTEIASNKLDLNQPNETDSKLESGDSVVIPDSKADPANNCRKTVSETALENIKAAEGNVDPTDHPSQNGIHKDKDQVPKVETEPRVGSMVSLESEAKPVKVNSPLSTDGDVEDGKTNNGEVPSQREGIKGAKESHQINTNVGTDLNTSPPRDTAD